MREFDKYIWHDIRKNPEDLPAEDCKVLRATGYGSGRYVYDTVYFSNNLYEVDECDFYDCRGLSGFYDYDTEWGHYTVGLDAWKYIEPFEEVE